MNAIRSERFKITKYCKKCGSIYGVYADDKDEDKLCPKCWNKTKAEVAE